MRFLHSLLLAGGLVLTALSAHATLSLQQLSPTFSGAVFATSPPGDLERLFVVEQAGRIKIWNLDTQTLNGTVFLDIDPLVLSGGERGLLGLAFSPDYATDGHFFLNYTNNSGNTVIARYTVSGNPDVANPASALIMKTWTQPFSNHNGGWLGFGPDGMLYIGMGDGGSGNDPGNRAQNLNEPMGKMMRLDPANSAGSYIAAGNPYIGVAGLDEIWSYGLRNPWRCSFDRATGELWIADVGQNAWEEISLQPVSGAGGQNYGWACREGLVCTGLHTCGTCAGFNSVAPVHVYNHAGGRCSITGGYVYRGPIPSLQGHYLFADYCSSQVWSLLWNGVNAVVTERTAQLPAGGNIVSFGEDAVGNVYIITPSRVNRIVSDECGSGPDCNNNGVPDDCDLLNGVAEDCNGNGVPDECDIAGGFSEDLDNDQIPDECAARGADDCPDAPWILDGTWNLDTDLATTDGPANVTCGGDQQIHNDVWLRYLAAVSGTLEVSLCGSAFDTELAVYGGGTCPPGGAGLLACNDNGCPGGGQAALASTLTLAITQGNTYTIRIGGSTAGDRGTGVLTLTASGTVGCGNSIDCNGNGTWDDCDIQNATSADCNTNGIPDECDISGGSSLDTNSNGVPDECEQAGFWESENFVSATSCAQCHSSGAGVYDDGGGDSSPFTRWQGTLMANSARDPYWKAKLIVETEAFGDPGVRSAIEATCTRCHAPMGSEEFRLADLGSYELDDLAGDTAGLEGVSCTLCHQQEPVDENSFLTWSGGFNTLGEHRIYGPFDGVDPTQMANVTGFTPQQGVHLGENGACVACHTLFTTALDANGLPVGAFAEQVPWLEQQNSLHAGTGCITCHMPELGGPAPISVLPGGLPPRAPRRDHAVLGGNALMLDLLAANADALGTLADSAALAATARLTEAYLRTAASLTALLDTLDGQLTLDVTVQNLTGHKFPTGIPVRRLWLEVIARDAGGQSVFHSGAWTADGHVTGEDTPFEAHHSLITAPDQIQIWEGRMMDNTGQPTFSLMRALGWAKDNRLLPAGYVPNGPWATVTAPVGDCTTDPDFNTAGSGADGVRYRLPASTRTVEVILNFQGVNPRVIDSMRASSSTDVLSFLAMWDSADRSPDEVAALSLAWPPLPELEILLSANEAVLDWAGGSFVVERRIEGGSWNSLGLQSPPFVDTGALGDYSFAEYRLRQP